MGRDLQAIDEPTIVIERKGYGADAWKWRLSNGLIDLAASVRGFLCAEDAYTEGKAALLQMRAENVRVVRRTTVLAFDEDFESFDLAV